MSQSTRNALKATTDALDRFVHWEALGSKWPPTEEEIEYIREIVAVARIELTKEDA